MRTIAASWLIVVILALEALFTPAGRGRAAACSYPPAPLEMLAPRDGVAEVPTNALLWVQSDGFGKLEIELTAGNVAQDVTTERIQAGLATITRIVPSGGLAPNTVYSARLRAEGVWGPAEKVVSFSTGAAPSYAAPTVPGALTAITTEYIDGRNSCEPTDGFKIELMFDAVPGAVLYELLQRTGDGLWRIETSTTPYLSRRLDALPSPIYRVRPVAITGIGPANELLPTAQGIRADRTFVRDELREPPSDASPPSATDAGCATAATRPGAWLIALLLLPLARGAAAQRGGRAMVRDGSRHVGAP